MAVDVIVLVVPDEVAIGKSGVKTFIKKTKR